MRINIKSINGKVFPFIVAFAYLFAILETYFYLGVLRKYILVNSVFFLSLASVSGVYLIGEKLNLLTKFVFKLTYFVFPVSLLLYLFLKALNTLNYDNFVFSRYHIQPENFLYLVVFSFILNLISVSINSKIIIRKPQKLLMIIVFLITFAFLGGVVNTVDEAVANNIYILTHLNSSYDSKMQQRWGIYYEYIKFVKENTPDDASILVPPQMSPWGSTGNISLDRYFLYPRVLKNGGIYGQPELNKFDYIMIAWGEEDGIEKTMYGWPKVAIPAENILYFDGNSKTVTEKLGNFDPKDLSKYGGWGLIKIKK